MPEICALKFEIEGYCTEHPRESCERDRFHLEHL